MIRKFSHLLLLLAGFFFPMIGAAKNVSPAKAQETANLFLYGNIPTKGDAGGVKLLWNSNSIAPATKGGDSTPAFYVFSGNGEQGFVIVAGDDIIKPILGYSFNKQAPEANDLPHALCEWLNDIAEHIGESRIKGATPTSAVKAEWDALAEGKIQNIWAKTRAGEEATVLETAEWGQGDPFNKECPLEGGKRTLTGCVATAVSTIMYYHKWPDKGVGKTDAYTTETKKLSVASRNLEIPYNWDKMLKKYKDVSHTPTEDDAVARLMADVGATFQADYESGSTSASTSANQMFKYFKYDSGMSYIARKDYFEEEFDNILRKEIDAKRPVLYAGSSDKGGGHAFVFDGYDSAGNFHINWGWSGSSNGFFPITEHDYKNKQRAFVHIMPATGKGTVPEYWITLYNAGIKSEIVNFDDYKPGEYFSATLLLNNRTAIDFDGYIKMAVENRAGEVKEWIMDERSVEISGRLTPGGTPTKKLVVNCKITAEPEIGDKITVYYSNDNVKWHKVHPDPGDWVNNVVWEVPIADTHYISETTSAKYNHNKRTFTFTYKKGVKPTLLLNGTAITEGVKADSTKMTIDVTKLEGEKLVLKLEKKRELEEIELSVEPAKK